MQVKREQAGGYDVKELTPAQLTLLGGAKLPKDASIAVFASKPKDVKPPNAKVGAGMIVVGAATAGCRALSELSAGISRVRGSQQLTSKRSHGFPLKHDKSKHTSLN